MKGEEGPLEDGGDGDDIKELGEGQNDSLSLL